MVRRNPRVRPELADQPGTLAKPVLGRVAREVSHGRTTIVLTWELAAGVASVWSMLTSPQKLRLWAPYSADHELGHVGRVVLTMLGDGQGPDVEVPSVVLVADPPLLLEHSWASDMLAWRLAPVGSGCRLTLHQTLADETMASANAAGWHLCVQVAATVLAGRPARPIRGMEAMRHGWPELNLGYAAALGVAPTTLGEVPKTA